MTLSEGPGTPHPVEPDPNKAMLDHLIAAPRSIQPLLMDVAKVSHVSVEQGDLVVVVHFKNVEEAIRKARRTSLRDISIAATIVAATMATTIILLRLF